MSALVCRGGSRSRQSCGQQLHVERQWDRDPATAIRCVDCGSLMCPRCAREHFAESDARRREVEDSSLERAALVCDAYSLEGNADAERREYPAETADELAHRIRALKAGAR